MSISIVFRWYFMLIVMSILLPIAGTSQVAINTSGNAPDSSAVLDISSIDKGLLIPRMSSTDRESIAQPAEGLLVYDNTSQTIWYYHTTEWHEIPVRPLTELTDADGDTKIQVEESTDDDVIRFDIAGMEPYVFYTNRLHLNQASSNSIIGQYAGSALTSGGSNSALGASALRNTTLGSQNVAIGNKALEANVAHGSNTAIGYEALRAATASNNTAIGANAMHNTTTGGYNSAFGERAMFNNLTGVNNLAVGNASLYNLLASHWNTAVGVGSMFALNSGNANTTVGYGSAGSLENGSYNTVAGHNAMSDLTSGQKNTVLGSSTLGNATQYDQGVFIGVEAGANVTSGSNSVMIGMQAGGNTDTSSTGNIFLGYRAGYLEPGSNLLYIENSSSTSPLIWGDFLNDTVKIYGTLGIADNYSFPTSDGDSSTVMYTDGQGNLSWMPVDSLVNRDTLSFVRDADGDTWIDTESGIDTDQIQFYSGGTHNATMSGHKLGVGTTTPTHRLQVSDNLVNASFGVDLDGDGVDLFFRNHAGSKDLDFIFKNGAGDTTTQIMTLKPEGNVGIGVADPQEKLHVAGNIRMVDGNQQPGYVMASDADGTATWTDINTLQIDTVGALLDGDSDTGIYVDENALDDDIIHFYLDSTEHFRMDGARLEILNSGRNVMIGQSAGLNTIGDDVNTFVGYEAGMANEGIGNIGIGGYAITSNINGIVNVAVGNSALGNKTSGGANTALGYTSLRDNLTGSNNTALGAYAGQNNTGSGNVFIGHQSGMNASGDNQLYIDNSNTSSPLLLGNFNTDSLVVNGKLDINGSIITSQNWISGDGGNEGLKILNNGNAGFNQTYGNVQLALKGNNTNSFLMVLTDSLGAGQLSLSAAGTMNTYNNWISGDGQSEGLMIDDGGSVNINRTFVTDNNWISGDGDDEGVKITDEGNVGTGVAYSNVQFTARNNTSNPWILLAEKSNGTNVFSVDSNGLINTYQNWISGDGDSEGLMIDSDGKLLINKTFNTNNQWISGDGDNEGFQIGDDGKLLINKTFNTNNQWLSGDGTNEGIQVDDAGGVTISSTSTTALLKLIPASSGNARVYFAKSNGTTIWNVGNVTSNNNFTFYDNEGGWTPMTIERGSFDHMLYLEDDGDVGIGTNSPAWKFHIKDNVVGQEQFVACVENTANNTSGRNSGLLIRAGHANYTSSQESSFVFFQSPDSNYCGRIAQDGNASVEYRTASDRRLKENFVPTRYGLYDLMKINVYEYNFIGDSTGEIKTGFIAQDLYDAFPPAVTVGGADPKQHPWEVAYGKVAPLLVKSLQDQQHLIREQEERIARLESLVSAQSGQSEMLTLLVQQLAELSSEIDNLKADKTELQIR